MERNHHATQIVDSLSLCNHIYKTGRECRQPVANPSALVCTTHLRNRASTAAPPDPLAELASELGQITEIHQVGSFIAKLITLACQNRISTHRAAVLTYMANSLVNALRLQRAEEVRAAKDDPDHFEIDLTGFPRPDRTRDRISEPEVAPLEEVRR